MKTSFVFSCIVVLTLTAIGFVDAKPNESNKTPVPPGDPGWPREYKANGAKLIVYQPQVDSWDDYTKLHYRAVVALTPAGKKEVYGVAEGDADTAVDESSRTVAINRSGYQLRFPGASEEDTAAYEKAVRAMVPESSAMVISLERVLAMLDPAKTVEQPPVEVNLDPPKILYSAKPAVLVMFMGTPQMKPVEKEKPDLMFAVNTNWDVFFDTTESKYYLLNKESWLTATDPVKGPWAAAGKLPAGLSRLPANENWSDVRKSLPGKKAKTIPTIFVTTEPTEMIVTTGEPAYAPIKGTKLMKITNTDSTLFMNNTDKQFYFLVAGRWFRAADLNGPWSAASKDLPPDFAAIPDDSPVAEVKSSVPGTEEAKDAVMLASVPRTTTVKASDAKLEVIYAGEPKFEPIKGTKGVQYATNSANAVLLVNGGYYVCDKGAWYCGGTAKGPWAYCAKVPNDIYTIPANHPLHNVTYVKVKSANDTTVVYTQTSGYSGEYVAATGVLMFGAGLLVGAAINDDCFYCWPAPYYYSYGCGAHYHYGYGGYYNAAQHYGPYGGAGGYAAYNPYTGTYSRGAYAYGPAGGSAGVRQAYNPYTDTYAARATRSTPNGSSGRFYAEQGNKSAWGGHESGARGTVGWAENSKGGQAVAWDTRQGQGAVAKDKNDNLYAAHDGNVYKKTDDGQWKSYENGKWNNVEGQPKNQAASARAENAGNGTGQSRSSGQTQSARASNSAMSGRTTDSANRTAQASRGEASSMNRDTFNSLDSDARSRQRGDQQTQKVSQFQRQGISGGGREGRARSGGGRRR
jgi:hypothetical protein